MDASILSPDQQFQAGLFCGTRARDSDDADQPELHVPCVAVRVYAHTDPGAGNGRRRPQPAAHPRRAICSIWRSATTISSTATAYKWSARVTVINVANKYALYNFLSTFSGTHYVTPRAVTGEIGFHF